MNRKLKILFIIPSFGMGGAEKVVVDYLTYLDKSAIDVLAISMYPNKNTLNDKEIENNNLNVVYLDKKPGIDLKISKKIYKVIYDFQPDVIHSHLNALKYLLYSFNKYKKAKYFHTIHSEPNKNKNYIEKFLNKIAFKTFKCTPIALTMDMKKTTNELYKIDTALSLNNGIDLSRYRNISKTKEEIRVELNLPEDICIIGHVGRFSKVKNHTFILDIFDEYLKIDPSAQLLLVGNGELRKEIELRAKELDIINSILFLGNRSDIPFILKAIDCFIFPSLHEGFPLSLIEAQALEPQLRCLVSDVIDSTCIINANTHTMGLDLTARDWAKELIKINKNDRVVDKSHNIEKFDIRVITSELIKLYTD